MNDDRVDTFLREAAKARLTRRELIGRGLAAGLSMSALAEVVSRIDGMSAFAANPKDFDWKRYRGTQVSLLLNKHPYVDAMVADIADFQNLTGMTVKYDIFPEDVYFDKVTTTLTSRSSQYDVFMTGAYQTWVYGPAGWLVDLKPYITDANKTAPEWDWPDILEGLRTSDSWNGRPGSPLGTADAKQWAIPWGFELNNVAYNRRLFAEHNLTLPKNLPDMVDKAKWISKNVSGVYGIAVRGSRSWATIHPGFLSAFTNYGAHDFDAKLNPTMNSPQAVEMTTLWIDMLKGGGPPNWTTYTWYEVGSDLGAGKAAMIYDATNVGFYQQTGTKEAGNIGYYGFTANPNEKYPTPNVWIWSLAMSSFSGKKDPAWYFMQWASGKAMTTFGAVKMNFVDPVRTSVWREAAFRQRVSEKYPGYIEQYEASAPHAKIYFTPEPLFFTVTTDWAVALQEMYAGTVGVKEGLDKLVVSIAQKLREAGVSAG
jgi:multiple sugar transport system substrate-binding protein